MATEEKAEIVEEIETVKIEAEKTEIDQKDEAEGEAPEDEAEETVIVSFEDEESPPQESEAAPDWVKDLRKQTREQRKCIKELESEKDEREAAAKAVELGPKPTLENSDYDEGKFADALLEWNGRKAAVDAEKKAAADAETQALTAWQDRLGEYEGMKADLKAPDFEDAEDAVREHMSQTQQGILVQGMDNPAFVIYALGRNPGKAKSLAAIKDPVKFAVAAAKLETTLKVSKQQKPQPEKKIKGAGRMSGAVDTTLDRLEAEAEISGDRSKILAHKRRLRQSTA